MGTFTGSKITRTINKKNGGGRRWGTLGQYETSKDVGEKRIGLGWNGKRETSACHRQPGAAGFKNGGYVRGRKGIEGKNEVGERVAGAC